MAIHFYPEISETGSQRYVRHTKSILFPIWFHLGQPSGIVFRGAGCYTKGPEFESRVRHGCQTIRPRHPQKLSISALKVGRREVPGSIFGRACRPIRSEFSVVFSETRVNTG